MLADGIIIIAVWSVWELFYTGRCTTLQHAALLQHTATQIAQSLLLF